jgi:hypothetical protein
VIETSLLLTKSVKTLPGPVEMVWLSETSFFENLNKIAG